MSMVEGIGVQDVRPVVVETELQVRYKETDQMGIVHHTNYIVWFELGRTEFIRKLGYSYSELEKRGLLLPVVDLHVRYHASARYEERVLVRTSIQEFSGAKITFAYELIHKEKGNRLVTGTTTHLWVNKEMKRVNLKKVHPELFQVLNDVVTR